LFFRIFAANERELTQITYNRLTIIGDSLSVIVQPPTVFAIHGTWIPASLPE